MKKVCQRCGHKWNYQGKASFFTSCPRCKTSVNVRKKIKMGTVKCGDKE